VSELGAQQRLAQGDATLCAGEGSDDHPLHRHQHEHALQIDRTVLFHHPHRRDHRVDDQGADPGHRGR